MAVAPSLLPVQPTPLVGREAELEAIVQSLSREHVHLLTLIGPAGVGKTRLALAAMRHVGDQFPDGVVFVDLAPVREPHLVLPAIAQVLGFADAGPRPLLERLVEYLRERAMLLVLDNFEQVLPAASALPALLAPAPALRIVVTSRVPLQLRWEQTMRLFPLAVPERDGNLPLDAFLRTPSIALFVDRARAHRPEFSPTEQQIPLLVQLIRQLDGLPLAIELAAATMSALPLAAITRRLDKQVQTLRWDAHDLPDRQRSLQAAIGWSYDLLPPSEQRLFRHLGVFVGRVALDAVEAIVGPREEDETLDSLVALVEKSLALPGRLDDDDPEPSFGMLETVRQFAYEQLEASGELEQASRAHAQYFLELAERANPELRGPDQVAWFMRVESAHDNLRAALRWLLDHDEHNLALRLAGALGFFWSQRGYHAEGKRWLEEALAFARREQALATDPGALTWAMLRAGLILALAGEPARSQAMLEEALALARVRDDRSAMAQALMYLGLGTAFVQDLAASHRLLQEALRCAEELQDDYQIGVTLGFLAYGSWMQSDWQEAATLGSAAVSRLQKAGDLTNMAHLQIPLALCLQQLGDLPKARRVLRESLATTLALRNRWLLSHQVEAMLQFAGEGADVESRARLLGAIDTLHQATGTSPGAMDRMFAPGVENLRARIEQEGCGAAYRAGRSLSLVGIFESALAMLNDVVEGPESPEGGSSERPSDNPLSAREHEVLRLVAEGLTNRQIGQQLFLSHRTVDHHLTSVFNKLGVENRAQAVAVAVRRAIG